MVRRELQELRLVHKAQPKHIWLKPVTQMKGKLIGFVYSFVMNTPKNRGYIGFPVIDEDEGISQQNYAG